MVIIIILSIAIVASPFLTANTEVQSSQERIKSFPTNEIPVREEAHIYWNKNLVPFIEAKTDADAAFLLGTVNAHLRLGQMELFRMLAQGRLAEMIGPIATQVDHGLRILDIDKAVDEIVINQDEHTRKWVQSFVDGINWYIGQMNVAPVEYRLFNIPRTQWTPEDVYRLARLASADLTWGVYLQALLLSKNEGWEKIWDFILEKGQRSIPSFSVNSGNTLSRILNNIAKSGSNSLVVSGQKSFNGHALMANDPHLGIFAPNMWLLVGYKSPSYHVVGMQIPGIPFIAVGRNTQIAWGGTNMRSISSHLIELDDEQLAKANTTTDTIDIRFWFNKKIQIRESEYGPVISDAPFLKHLDKNIAIQWLGHEPSNELRSFLLANRAGNFSAFRQAFKSYAVSGQSLVYADNEGNIGLVPAYTQPVLRDTSKTLELLKNNGNHIVGGIDPYDLPFSFNPVSGYIASANNLPYNSKIPISFDHSGFNRMQRMMEICESTDSITMEMLTAIQTGVVSNEAIALQKLILDKTSAGKNQFLKAYPRHWELFINWEGNYEAASSGAAAFEILMYYLTLDYLNDYYPQQYMQDFFMNENRWQLLLPRLIRKETDEQVISRLLSALKKSKRNFKKYESWGDMHRLEFGSPIARIPLIGNRYRLAEQGIGGTSNTLMKTAHSFSPRKHSITYGSNARHISNMADIDENYFVLLGGQDAWIKSPHNHDQLELWNKEEYIRMPLRLESIREEFDYHTSIIK